MNLTMVQSSFVPSSSGPMTAVVVSGGKQYRVASGDRILVDRLAAEPGARLALERVLMITEGDDVKLGADALAGQVVTVRVIGHRRGPKIDVLRYRPKKRVRVHRGARADLTALEILSVGPPPAETGEQEGKQEGEKPARRRRKDSRPRPSSANAEAAEPEASKPAAAEPETEAAAGRETEETTT